MRIPHEMKKKGGWTYYHLNYIEQRHDLKFCTDGQRATCNFNEVCMHHTIASGESGKKKFFECRRVEVRRWRLAREANKQ
jgi:hypothetical protein